MVGQNCRKVSKGAQKGRQGAAGQRAVVRGLPLWSKAKIRNQPGLRCIRKTRGERIQRSQLTTTGLRLYTKNPGKMYTAEK